MRSGRGVAGVKVKRENRSNDTLVIKKGKKGGGWGRGWMWMEEKLEKERRGVEDI